MIRCAAISIYFVLVALVYADALDNPAENNKDLNPPQQTTQNLSQEHLKKTSSPTHHNASWYNDKGKKTASGIKSHYGVAHRTLPFGTKILITNPKNGKSVTAFVVDRGPFTKGRELDINQNIAEFLQFKGIGKLLFETQ